MPFVFGPFDSWESFFVFPASEAPPLKEYKNGPCVGTAFLDDQVLERTVICFLRLYLPIVLLFAGKYLTPLARNFWLGFCWSIIKKIGLPMGKFSWPL